ncbi:tetratricopeptide repeat protein 24-like [Pogona vitticeps]
MASAPSSESVEGWPEGHTGPVAKKETRSLLREGIAFFQAGEEARALARFKKAYLLSGRLGEPHTRATCLFNLGATYVATGQAEKGLKCLKKAGRLTGEVDPSLYFNLAMAYENLGEPQRAAEFYRKALRGYSASQGRGVGERLGQAVL